MMPASTRDRVPELLYDLDGVLTPLPTHLQFFYEFGRWMAANRSSEFGILAAFAVSSRAFVGPFIALGFLSQAARIAIGNGTVGDLFDLLWSEEFTGALIDYVINGKRRRGKIEGTMLVDGRPAIKVKYESDHGAKTGAWDVIWRGKASQIGLVEIPDGQNPEQMLGTLGKFKSESEFIRAACPPLLRFESSGGTSPSMCVTGTKEWWNNELLHQKFSITDGAEHRIGVLNSFLKLKGVGNLSEKPRIDFRKVHATPGASYDFVISDGATAALDSLNRFRGINHVVIVDMTETKDRQEVVFEALNSRFTERMEWPLNSPSLEQQHGVFSSIFAEVRR